MTDEKRSRIKELEETLSYLVNDSMTLEEKLKSLSDAYWEASHSGYGDAMANKLMGGEEDEQTRLWEKNCKNKFIKNDPVEKTEKYLAVIDKVEEKIEKTKQMDFCLEYWSLKARFLFEYGILWRSPTQLNPGVMFD